MKWTALLVVALCTGVAGTAVAGTWQHEGPRVAAAASAATTVGDPQDPAVLAAVYGIRFTAQAVVSGTVPLLPNGQQGVPMDQAISAAMDAAPAGIDYEGHRLLPDVQAAAQFGLYSNDRYGQRLPAGQVQPYLQGRPVWVVTFSGPGVQLHPHGPRPAGSVHNEVSVVIDAATGQYLMGYSYR